MNAYQELENRFRTIGRLQEASAILGWDQETMMPHGSAESRAEQLAALENIVHELIIDQRTSEWLEKAAPAEAWQKSNLIEMRRQWRSRAAIPTDLAANLARQSSIAAMSWREGREKKDFKAFLPEMEKLLSLTQEKAAILAKDSGQNPYDALLDLYEPGMAQNFIDPLFASLQEFLRNFLPQVLAEQKSVPKPKGPFPVEKQQALCRRLMAEAGFDFNKGRLDVSTHPFCGGTADDVRITTRYNENDFAQSLMGLLHETGHALYEMGLPVEWRGLPIGQARGMALHESQSLLLEMQACRSREFMTYLTPLLQEYFGGDPDQWQADKIYRAYTQVRPSLIRTEADEVTYPLHIILRYRLERMLVAGELKLADLPEAFNSGMQELLGIRPNHDAEGCWQDIHWPSGSFGYFPTYTLGAMTAAQLFQAACKTSPEIKPSLATGNFAPLVAWLRENVHRHASSKTTAEIIKGATGKDLTIDAFTRHLQHRYGAA
ncbi:MAG: carboxypeptidase M32 [Dongiaceae bacterium]